MKRAAVILGIAGAVFLAPQHSPISALIGLALAAGVLYLEHRARQLDLDHAFLCGYVQADEDRRADELRRARETAAWLAELEQPGDAA